MFILMIGVAFCGTLQAGQYDDLANWAATQKTDGQAFISDLQKAKTAAAVVAALKASARQQTESTNQLIKIVKRHPELRNLPELGLDRQALEMWAEANPDADAKRAKVPPEAQAIYDKMKSAATELAQSEKNREAIGVLSQFHEDEDVIAASNELRAAMADNRRHLLNIFL